MGFKTSVSYLELGSIDSTSSIQMCASNLFWGIKTSATKQFMVTSINSPENE